MSDTTTNLGSIITNAIVRKSIYAVYAVGIVVLGAIQVGFASVPDWGGQPAWLTAALAVAAYLGVPIGGLALANTSTTTATVIPVDAAPTVLTPSLNLQPGGSPEDAAAAAAAAIANVPKHVDAS